MILCILPTQEYFRLVFLFVITKSGVKDESEPSMLLCVPRFARFASVFFFPVALPSS